MRFAPARRIPVLALVFGATVILAQQPWEELPGGLQTSTQPKASTAAPEAAVQSGVAETSWGGWESEVWAPVVRLAAIALILGALLWWLELKSVLPKAVWSERTIVALAIIFTFCAAALMNVANHVFDVLKDVALVVIGFYFGAARDRDEPRHRGSTQPYNKTRKSG